MGRHGHLQTRHAEHNGPSLTAYCSQHAADFLTEAGIELVSHPSDCSEGDADQWEIAIPVRLMEDGLYRRDYDAILDVARRLREDPSLVKGDYVDAGGDGYGDDLAVVLENGVAVAKEHDYGWIIIDWWD